MTALFIYFATTNSGALRGLAPLLVNKLSEERQVLARRLGLRMALVMRAVAPLPRVGHRAHRTALCCLGQEIPANVKIPSPEAHRSSDDPAARKEPPVRERRRTARYDEV